MRDYAVEALEMAAAHSAQDLGKDRKLQLALTRLVEVVGEAATRVSAETRAAAGEIPWRAITGMRNRLIHGYDVVDIEVLRQTIQTDLPVLVASLDKLIEELARRRSSPG